MPVCPVNVNETANINGGRKRNATIFSVSEIRNLSHSMNIPRDEEDMSNLQQILKD